jgi:hypothetical protein
VFAKACELGLEGIVSKGRAASIKKRDEPRLAEDKEPEFREWEMMNGLHC